MNSLILRLVEVENFMGHEYERLEFGHGVILLSGASGNGKSSLIVDAPGFALFGYRATRAAKIEKLRRRGSDTKAFRVKVGFERSDGLILEVERGHNDMGKSFVYSQDNRTDQKRQGAGEVYEHLVSIIGFMDAETYRRSFLTEQKNQAVITDMKPTPRKAFLNKTVGIDMFPEVAKEARSNANTNAKRIKELQELLGGQSIKDLEEQIETQDKLIEDLRKQSQSLDAQAQALHEQAEKAAKALAELAPKLTQRREIEAQVAAHEQQLARLQGQIAGANPAERERMSQLVAIKDDLVAQGKQLAAQVKQMDTDAQVMQERERASERVSTAAAHVKSLQDALGTEPEKVDGPKIKALHAELDERRVDLMSQLADIERQISTVEAGTCSTCGRDYAEGEAHNHGEALAERKKQVSADLESVQKQLAQASEQLDKARALKQERALWSQRQAELQRAIEAQEAAQKQLDSYQQVTYDSEAHQHAREQLAELRAQNAQVKSAQAWLQENPDPAQLQEQADKTTAERDKLAAQLPGLPQTQESDKLVDTERQLRRDESQIRTQLAQEVSAAENAQRQSEAMGARLAKLSEAATEAKQLHDEVARYKDIAQFTDQFWKHLSDEIRPQLSDIASDLMNRISHGTHPRLELSADYDLTVFEDTGDEFDAGELSGGEADRANFALRVALTRLITSRTGTPLGYLVLDEIFSAQDSGHIERMIDILESLQAHYPQIFLISHAPVEDYEIVRYKVDVTERRGRQRVKVYSR